MSKELTYFNPLSFEAFCYVEINVMSYACAEVNSQSLKRIKSKNVWINYLFIFGGR